MAGWLARLFGRRRPAAPPLPPVSPDAPFQAVGDIHGRADLLERLIPMLDDGMTRVFVGDYIDRGEDSAAVLARLMESGAICLKGNHEQMMLDFLDSPERRGGRWLRNGGLQTLASFGVGLSDAADPAALKEARDALRERMGEEMERWLRNLRLDWSSGNVAVVHAGADPELPMEDQAPEVLIWGHPAFERVQRRDGLWVVHGHTIVDAPGTEGGRISIDTGAYATGRLTAATVAEGEVTFLAA